MGIVVRAAFDGGRASPAERRKRKGGAAACEIVIFPGVRIERHDEPPSGLLPPRKASGPRRRKRTRQIA
ncbi:MAG: hypothetical protein U1E56_00565 [Bauldia sp.]